MPPKRGHSTFADSETKEERWEIGREGEEQRKECVIQFTPLGGIGTCSVHINQAMGYLRNVPDLLDLFKGGPQDW